MSGITFFASTLAQLAALGVNRLFLAEWAKTPISGLLSFRVSSEVLLGMTWPTVAIWVWYLAPVRSLTQSWARSWFLLLAPMPRSEPPRNTGAVCPSVWLGI